MAICTGCRDRKYNFVSHRSLFEYDGNVRDLLYYYKFRGRRRVSLVIADLFADILEKDYAHLSVVPVPSRRGVEHIEQICRQLSGRHGISVSRCLVRKPGKPQKTLGYEERLINMRDRIGLKKGSDPPGRQVVVIDDIYTTGATVDECARCLVGAGSATVHALTFAMDLP